LAGASSAGAVRIIADAGTLTVGADAVNTGSVSSSGNGNITLESTAGNAIVRAGIATGAGAVSITAGSDVTLGRTGSTVAQGGNSVSVSAQRQITGLGNLTVTSSDVTLAAGAIAPVGGRSIAHGRFGVLGEDGSATTHLVKGPAWCATRQRQQQAGQRQQGVYPGHRSSIRPAILRALSSIKEPPCPATLAAHAACCPQPCLAWPAWPPPAAPSRRRLGRPSR
jgi:hypothetical protein